jgi:hypothetical protein
MEIKVVEYPSLSISRIYFKSPKAYMWGTVKDKETGDPAEFTNINAAIEQAQKLDRACKEKGNARVIWRNKPAYGEN